MISFDHKALSQYDKQLLVGHSKLLTFSSESALGRSTSQMVVFEVVVTKWCNEGCEKAGWYVQRDLPKPAVGIEL